MNVNWIRSIVAQRIAEVAFGLAALTYSSNALAAAPTLCAQLKSAYRHAAPTMPRGSWIEHVHIPGMRFPHWLPVKNTEQILDENYRLNIHLGTSNSAYIRDWPKTKRDLMQRLVDGRAKMERTTIYLNGIDSDLSVLRIGLLADGLSKSGSNTKAWFYSLIFVGIDHNNIYIDGYFDLVQSGGRWLLFGQTDNILANITSYNSESGISIFRDDTVCVID